jgi:hypothetical protein
VSAENGTLNQVANNYAAVVNSLGMGHASFTIGILSMRERPAKVSLNVQSKIDILLEIRTNLWLLLHFHFRIFKRKQFIENVGHFDVPGM